MQFTVPSGYSEIPIGLSISEARADISARVAMAAEPPTEGTYRRMSGQLHRLSQILQRIGALYAGSYLHKWEDELSFGSLLIAVQSFEYGNAVTATHGINRYFRSRHGKNIVGKPLELPCGPAVVITSEQEFILPPETSGTGNEVTIPLAQLQAFIPIPRACTPDGEFVAVATFLTPCHQHWNMYAEHLASLLRSIEFTQEPAAPHAHTSSGR